MKKILLIFGTRPEAIKLAPIIYELKKVPSFETTVCVTAQHRDMLDQVLDFFKISPKHDLDIMKENQELVVTCAEMINALAVVVKEEAPDLIIVHGDTISSMCASLVAYLSNINVAHVEAGLRSGNLKSPWPEEGARTINGVLSKFHFSPTKVARQNLLKENINSDNIYVVGNTVIDALKEALAIIDSDANLKHDILSKFDFLKSKRKKILLTCHRRESFGLKQKNILHAIKKISQSFEDVDIIFPVHLNPNVAVVVKNILGGLPNVYLTDPVSYPEFILTMSLSDLILSDSGGIQEEAPYLNKPVLLLRDTTERPEAIAAGTVKMVGTDKDVIYNEVDKIFTDEMYCKGLILGKKNPYGDGDSAKKIIQILKERVSLCQL